MSGLALSEFRAAMCGNEHSRVNIRARSGLGTSFHTMVLDGGAGRVYVTANIGTLFGDQDHYGWDRTCGGKVARQFGSGQSRCLFYPVFNIQSSEVSTGIR